MQRLAALAVEVLAGTMSIPSPRKCRPSRCSRGVAFALLVAGVVFGPSHLRRCQVFNCFGARDVRRVIMRTILLATSMGCQCASVVYSAFQHNVSFAQSIQRACGNFTCRCTYLQADARRIGYLIRIMKWKTVSGFELRMTMS